MSYDIKIFSDNAKIEYKTIVYVNGIKAGQVTSYDEEGLIEQYRKLDYAMEIELRKQFNDIKDN